SEWVQSVSNGRNENRNCRAGRRYRCLRRPPRLAVPAALVLLVRHPRRSVDPPRQHRMADGFLWNLNGQSPLPGKRDCTAESSIRARSLRLRFLRFFALSVEALLEFFAGTESCPLAGGDLKGLARCGIASALVIYWLSS